MNQTKERASDSLGLVGNCEDVERPCVVIVLHVVSVSTQNGETEGS